MSHDILDHVGYLPNEESCDSNQNSLLNKSNKIIDHWGSFLTLLRFTFSFAIPFPCLHPFTYLPIPFTLLTVLSYSIHSAPHLLFHIHDPLPLHAPTFTPPMIVRLTHCIMHGLPLTPVDLPSSLYYIRLLVGRISLKLILLCTT